MNLSNFICAHLAIVLLVTTKQYVRGFDWVPESITRSPAIHEVIELLNELNGIPSIPIRRDEIINLIKTTTAKLDGFSEAVFEENESLSEMNFTSMRLKLKHFLENVNEIKSRYMRMKSMLQSVESYENLTQNTFAESNLNEHLDDSIASTLFDLHSMFFGTSNTNNLRSTVEEPLCVRAYREFQHARSNDLNMNTSSQQYLYRDYLIMIILEIQGYLVNKFSWTILNTSDTNVPITDEEIFWRTLESRTRLSTEEVLHYLDLSDTELERYDPPVWKEEVNYDQLTRLVQGFVVNEASLNDVHSCSLDCNFYVNDKVYCYDGDPHCQRADESAKILKCESDVAHDLINICPSNSRARRYEYINVNRHRSKFMNRSGKFYGKFGFCPRKEVEAEAWVRGFYSCNYCFCLVDGKSEKSDRFFSLREVLSDIKANKVVTGVRFVKKNRVMYLQIQQGELAPLGLIKRNTASWKDVEVYKLSKENDGIDYVTLDSGFKSIDLGDIRIESSPKVVTGVKISKKGSRLALNVHVTEYNFTSGKLDSQDSASEWIFDLRNHNAGVPLSHEDDGPMVSTQAPGKSEPTDSSYNFVEFTHSSKKYDASQTTLPFFDTQDVISNSPVPLSGVGLYHKGFDGYGGFLAPKIFTINLRPYV